MSLFLAQAAQSSIFTAPAQSVTLWMLIGMAFLVGLALIAGLTYLPTNLRKPLIIAVTFIGGIYFVLYWLWPQPIQYSPDSRPLNGVEKVGFWLKGSQGEIANIVNVLGGFLIGLGVYSLLRIHLSKLVKQQKDWFFSAVLVGSMVLMLAVGFMNWRTTLQDPDLMFSPDRWTSVNRWFNLLFDGMMQQMDAAMFSLVAFYIMSAAYRAFRVRSFESTILLGSALIVILSLIGLVVTAWDNAILSRFDSQFANNFTLTTMAGWLKTNIQTSGLRALDFGLGAGLLAVSLRIWLSLDKGAVGNS